MIFKSESKARRAHTGLLTIAMALSLGACGILDVSNPNNLVQEDIENPAAGAAMASGAFAAVARALAEYGAPVATASDELTWIGSRDAWS